MSIDVFVMNNGLNNTILVDGTSSQIGSKRSVKISGNNNSVVIGKSVRLKDTLIQMRGNNGLIEIQDGARLNGVNIFISDGSRVVIGNHSTFSRSSIRAEGGKNVWIGKDCMISSDVYIRTSDGHGIFSIDKKELLNPPADVVIEDHVWLGRFVKVNKGVNIGKNSVVGQASLVTKDIERNRLYAGVPARLIRDNIIWSRSMDMEDIPLDYIKGV